MPVVVMGVRGVVGEGKGRREEPKSVRSGERDEVRRMFWGLMSRSESDGAHMRSAEEGRKKEGAIASASISSSWRP